MNEFLNKFQFLNLKRHGFTLAEVLITLVVVGIISAVTTPVLMKKYTEQQTVSAVKKFYSEISQAYNSAILKNGTPDTWNWANGTTGSEYIMNLLSNHLRIMNRCKPRSICAIPSIYKTLNTNINWAINLNNESSMAVARLDNGSLFWIWTDNNCTRTPRGNSIQLKNVCGEILVDINGQNKPNVLGKDVFMFYTTKYNVLPVGTRFETFYSLNNYCDKRKTDQRNGYACTAWIIEKGNMDYLYTKVSW